MRELTKLKSVTRPRSQDAIDFKLQIAAMARGLIDLPDLSIESGCASWAETSQWFPSLAELRAECLKYKKADIQTDRMAITHEGFSDKRWWYDQCAKRPDDEILLAKAREIYPTMFYDDGGLVEFGQIDFQARDRVSIGSRV